MISMQELLGPVAQFESLSPEVQSNLKVLLERINVIRRAYGRPMKVTSGYRTPEHNKAIGGAKSSNHLKGAACDIYDPKKELQAWCLKNVEVLKDAQLWCEDFSATKTWCHFQTVMPKSGKRFFKP